MPGCPPCTVGSGRRPRGGDHRRCSGAALSVWRWLLSAALSLEVGARYDAVDLCRRLTAAGYTRTDCAEGPGQPPAGRHSGRVLPGRSARRVVSLSTTSWSCSSANSETAIQRRVLNRRQVCILPASELLPFAEETTASDAAGRMGGCRPPPEEGARRHSSKQSADDAELLRQGSRHLGATAIWPPSARTRPPRLTIWPRTPFSRVGEAGRCRRRSGPSVPDPSGCYRCRGGRPHGRRLCDLTTWSRS